MIIFYVAEWDVLRVSGVTKKILSTFNSWRQAGQRAGLMLISPEVRGRGCVKGEPGCILVEHWRASGVIGKIGKIFAIIRAGRILKEVNPDVIYYRQSSWTPGVMRLLKSGACLVVEINSLDLHESKHYGLLRAFYHRVTREFLLRQADGIVCVSEEIAESVRIFGKPMAVIANGFDLEEARWSPRLLQGRLQFVFVGTPAQRWHGIDKILDLALRLKEYDFHIVGDVVESPPGNVTSHGYITGDALEALYERMHFGIGSLALHRKEMKEASPLKTREYLAHGLPVVAAYDDTDLRGCEFFLRLIGTGDEIENWVQEIRRFAAYWACRTIDRDAVRARIGLREKERARLQFMERILLQRGPRAS